jgi:hypothetical protein
MAEPCISACLTLSGPDWWVFPMMAGTYLTLAGVIGWSCGVIWGANRTRAAQKDASR